MRNTMIAAVLATAALCAGAEPTFIHGPVTVRLLDSECSSEVAIEVLKTVRATTKPKRADMMIAGTFVPACWAEDADGDILIADRHVGVSAIYRRWFTEIGDPKKARRRASI